MFCFFFFNDTATTEIYTLSLHDALPICRDRTDREAGTRVHGAGARQEDRGRGDRLAGPAQHEERHRAADAQPGDRKSTRLNSSHSQISYAVFCLEKKKTKTIT